MHFDVRNGAVGLPVWILLHGVLLVKFKCEDIVKASAAMAPGKMMLVFLAWLLLLVSVVGVAGVIRSNNGGLYENALIVMVPNVKADAVFSAESRVSAFSSRLSMASLSSWWWSSQWSITSLSSSTGRMLTLLSSSLMAVASDSPTGFVETSHNETKERSRACPPSCFRPNPVCGVDGVTYWCGPVDAECASVEVDYTGFCDFGSKGTGDTGVLAIQSFFLVHTIWLMLAAFLVVIGVP